MRAIGVGLVMLGLLIAVSPFLAISFEEASKDKDKWKWMDDFPAWTAAMTSVTGFGICLRHWLRHRGVAYE